MRRVRKKDFRSLLEIKSDWLGSKVGVERCNALKRWYKFLGYRNTPAMKLVSYTRRLGRRKLPLLLSFFRWLYIDLLRGKVRRKHGIFMFVALPGEGKTMSMVAHMERYRKECVKKGVDCVIASNFTYKHNDYYISHWSDMVAVAKECYKNNVRCVIALDEIHVTFDSSDWKSFPAEILAMLSFNRKYGLQFLCSSQIYERIPKKIRDIANFTIICKNILRADRWFRCYYFEKGDYEAKFEGKKKKAKFVREFIADDDFYRLYDTLEQIDVMTENASREKDLKQKAFEILFEDRNVIEEGDS
jgi:ATP-dependent Clp protease ATP-binding subunit ClpX